MVYFGEGTCRSVLVGDPKAHPMINQDVAVGMAKGNSFKIQDAYTPSRARPLPDTHFGGQDDILDANAFEAEGFTYMKFIKPLETADSAADYCLLPDVNYLMIYALGQTPESYSHQPASSLEVGKAGNKGFYGEDELKFHGGGIGTTHENRGSFGLVNFFAKEESGSCVGSTLANYACMKEVLPNGFNIHWKEAEDRVTIAAEAQTAGWIAIAWPKAPGEMIGATALMSFTLTGEDPRFGFYELNSKAVSGVISTRDPYGIADIVVSEQEGKTILEFSRFFDAGFVKTEVHDLLVAFHSGDELAYHGINRGPLQLSFQSSSDEQVPRESQKRSLVNPEIGKETSGCEASKIQGLDCSITVLPGVKLDWRVDANSVSFALEAPGNGWVSVAWPETPGSMVPSKAVLGTSSDLGIYQLTGKDVESIIPDSTLFSINSVQSQTSNGKLLIQFTR